MFTNLFPENGRLEVFSICILVRRHRRACCHYTAQYLLCVKVPPDANICTESVSDSWKELEFVSKTASKETDTNSEGLSDKRRLDAGELYHVYRFVFQCHYFCARSVLFPRWSFGERYMIPQGHLKWKWKYASLARMLCLKPASVSTYQVLDFLISNTNTGRTKVFDWIDAKGIYQECF